MSGVFPTLRYWDTDWEEENYLQRLRGLQFLNSLILYFLLLKK